MRIVVDTNVLISGIHWGGIPAEILMACISDRIKVICSAEIIQEYREVLQRMNSELSLAESDKILSSLIGQSEIVQPKHWFKIVLEDPEDDKFIDCAFHAQAKTIISGDKHLLRLKKFGSIRIMSPAEFKKKNQKFFPKA
jgi:putative PIN family toxin of toxin-antitoxin system